MTEKISLFSHPNTYDVCHTQYMYTFANDNCIFRYDLLNMMENGVIIQR